MRTEFVNEFITPDEQQEFADWFKTTNSLKEGLSRGQWNYKYRKTTRQQQCVDFPDVAYKVKDRIKNHFGFGGLMQEIDQGMIAVVTHPEGDTYWHCDPPSRYGHPVTCNILIQAADSGGVLCLDEEEIALKERELHCYLPSKYWHGVTKVEGNKDRYMWIYRFIDNSWES